MSIKVKSNEFLFQQWKKIADNHPYVASELDFITGLFQNDIEVIQKKVIEWSAKIEELKQRINLQTEETCKLIDSLVSTSLSYINGSERGEVFSAYVDGFCKPNPGKMGLGGYIVNSQGERVSSFSLDVGEGTNNKAEYLAVIHALNQAVNIGVKNLRIYTDSQLVVNQTSGKWKAKDPDLAHMAKLLRRTTELYNIEIIWMPREMNKEADRLSSAAF